MVRFHEELLRLEETEHAAPDITARALRTAQTWLRGATHEDLRRFRARHDLSPDHWAGEEQSRDLGPLRDAPVTGSRARPFAAPRHWASFITIG